MINWLNDWGFYSHTARTFWQGNKMNENLDDFVNEATGKNADGSLTVEQLFAIRKSGEVGKRLQEDFPEIADRYRNGMTMHEISLEYCIQELYDVSREVARGAIRYALGGHNFGGILYLGLIEDEEERRNLGLDHLREHGKATYEMGKGIHGRTAEQMSEHGRKGGEALYERGLGIHGMTSEQRTEHGKALYEMGKGIHGRTAEQMSEHGRKGGEALYEMGLGIHGMTSEQRTEHGKALYEMGKGIHGLTTEQRRENGRKIGKATYEMGKGIHGRTAEQMSEHGRKGGEATYEMRKGIHGLTTEQRSENSRKNVIARGLVPWVPAEETNEHYRFSELETAYRLSQCPEYRRGSLIKNTKIAGELNTIFHNEEPVRNASAVNHQLSNYKKNVQ